MTFCWTGTLLSTLNICHILEFSFLNYINCITGSVWCVSVHCGVVVIKALHCSTGGVWWMRGPIHSHCPKIYLKTCHKIILWQKLRCHKMILRHILRQFTKFVLRDLKYFQDMTRCHSNYDVRLFRFRICIWHMYPFYPFVTEPAHTRTSIHSTKRTALPQYGHLRDVI